jgi:fibro-slime domain-containing protein
MNNPDAGGPDLNVDSGSGDAATNTDADTTEAGPTCGDGAIDTGEQCDDGNSKPGDGCDGTCQKEGSQWDCSVPGQLCTPVTTPAVCGNGVIEGDEACDLGTAKNDGTQGCNADCTLEQGWSCPANGDPCTRDAYCGDGIVQNTLGESCDDGTNDGTKGCSTTCQKLPGYNCPPTGGACSVAAYCGNGMLDSGETCDDHNRRSYDGCSATCLAEPGFSCPAGGGACVRLCGNSKLDSGENCDDGNFLAGDGCSSTCQREADYTCSTVGQPCLYTPPPPPAVCGNGTKEGTEGCDDGNATGGDGCSSTCKLEAGWTCPTQNAPCVAAKCGDGILAGTEKCDDGNTTAGDGCSASCTIEAGAVCPANGGQCVAMKCGDSKVTGTETCDDGVNDGKHGCSATCQVMTGWQCPFAGAACTPICGDGIVAGDEQCDEKGAVACCTAQCKLVPGFVCDSTKTPHSQNATPYCGDGVLDGPANATVRGLEQCDDHNTLPYDGCSPTCTNEPLCGTVNTSLPPAQQTSVPYQCFAQCGDGIILPPEECDDGNTQTGDGCDASCKVEKNPSTNQPAWTCIQAAPPATLSIPVIWRDFSPRTNGQFEVNPIENRRLPGITQTTLTQVTVAGALHPLKYVPAYNTSFKSPTWGGGDTNVANWTMNAPGWVGPCTTATCDVTLNPATGTAAYTSPQMSTAFGQWYVDDTSASPVSLTFASTLPLKTIAGGALQYTCVGGACDNAATFATTDGFFPLDGKGWVAQAKETSHTSITAGLQHNFHFTTEARYWFAFQGGENLAFFGDDDVWVFVNGTLALDIGGIHSQTNGQFTLNADGTATSCAENIPGDGGNTTNCTTVNLGLVKGQVYEVAVFNAERHVTGSNFQLTIKGFNNQPSVCTPICGDGYIAGTEQCDRGTGNVDPSGSTYGKCTTACKLGPYCGDAKVLTPPETCDNGVNIDAYVNKSPAAQMCAPGCKTPDYCGDGVIQKVDGEECDDGTAGNQNTYGHCQTNCHLGARCGDGAISNGEACDDGPNNGAPSSACSATCQKKCGNGVVDTGEQCDDGTGATGNGTAGSTCDTSCRLKCGNGQLDAGEQCDDGKNDGSYGSCNANCTLAPYCGDKTVQNPPEACDNGTAANLPTAYGPTSCTDQCLPGGFCGDGLINGPEKCDDGQNTGLPGSCKADCSAYIPTKLCGDGMIQAPEKCDDGKNNGTATSKCDTSCRLKCGNGTIDPGEQCDNGVNDGSYGTCTSTCQFAGYCGDGIKNGNEQCDKGVNNKPVKTAYGTGVCTTSCLAAPFCGDGRVQSAFGEDCEGNDLCSDCHSTVPK